jgi:hypothetical protein
VPDRGALADALGLTEPLVASGVILVGHAGPPADGPLVALDLHDALVQAATLELDGIGTLVDCSAETGAAPSSTGNGPGPLLAIGRTNMTAPAEAEGLARRIADRLERRPVGDWAIGVAVSHRSDSARDLIQFAERALYEAKMLGGRRVWVFDDVEREPQIRSTGRSSLG